MKNLFYRIARWEYAGLGVLALITAASHFSVIMQPGNVMFDEVYYVEDARRILQGAGTMRPEHPPLGKLFVTLGIFLFGDNPLGWRILSVLFGTLAIVLFYLICRRLAMSRQASFLAAFLLSFENLSFVQAGVAMLDVFYLTLMLGAFWLYLKGRCFGSGIMLGLSSLTKLTGVLAAPVVFLHWMFVTRKGKGILILLVSSAAAFFILMPLFDFIILHKVANPFSQLKTMLSLSSQVTITKFPAATYTRPWEWVLLPMYLPYWWTPRYLGMISPTLWALIVPAMVYAVFRAVKRDSAAIFALAWFAGTYLIWIPASIITDRTSYVYYFYPTVGAVCIALGLGLSRLIDVSKTRQPGKIKRLAKWIVPAFLLLHLVAFVILAPSPWWVKVPLSLAAYAYVLYYLRHDENELPVVAVVDTPVSKIDGPVSGG